MAAAAGTRRGNHGSFSIETDLGVRLVEFDRDAFRSRWVRILVDGATVAELPHPVPAAPYHEASFQLDGFDLVGAAWLPASSWRAGLPLAYDVFSDGKSLTDGSALTDTRAQAPAPRKPYPASFRAIDLALWIAPMAAAPAMAGGFARRGTDLGVATLVALVGLALGALLVASRLAVRRWARISADESLSERQRAALGWATAGAFWAVALAVVVVLLLGPWAHRP